MSKIQISKAFRSPLSSKGQVIDNCCVFASFIIVINTLLCFASLIIVIIILDRVSNKIIHNGSSTQKNYKIFNNAHSF